MPTRKIKTLPRTQVYSRTILHCLDCVLVHIRTTHQLALGASASIIRNNTLCMREYILNVRRVVPLTEDEMKQRDRNERNTLYSTPGFGVDYNVKTTEVLSVVLTEEEYNRAKTAIIQAKN